MKKKQKNMGSLSVDAAKSSVEKHRGRLSHAFSVSIIFNLIDRFTNYIYDSILYGFFGRIFTAYSREELAFENGFVRNYFKGGGSPGKHFHNFCGKFSKAFENSFILDKVSKFSKEILSTSVKYFGNFLISFGLYSVLVYFIRELVPGLVVPDGSFLFVAVVSVICATPLLTSKESLGRTLMKGKITRLILMDALGFKDEFFDVAPKKSKGKANFAILFGMVFGLLTFFVHPMYLPVLVFLTVITAMVFKTPEIGVIATVFMIPFFSFFSNPSAVLSIFVGVSATSYLIKFLRGKRIFKVGLLEVFIILFAVVIYMAGIISAGGASSFASAVMSCVLMLGFFLVVNLMRTEKWMNRCVSALVSSSVAVSVIGILQYIFGYAKLNWIDTAYFPEIGGRVVSVFNNPNILAAYLVMSFPLLIAKMQRSKSKQGKLLGILSMLCVIVCNVLTWSRGAWLAMLISSLIMGLINNRKTLKKLMGICIFLPVLYFVIPHSVVKRFMSIGDMADSSTYYRVYTWRGTVDAIKDYFWGGAGFGNSAFKEIYPQYSYAGIESVEHSHNLFLQLLFGLGIFGLAVFIVVFVLFMQKNLEYFKNYNDRPVKLMSSAAFAAICGALVLGTFDYVWYNSRLFFMFWVIMAISCAYIRYGEREAKRKSEVDENTPEHAFVDI